MIRRQRINARLDIREVPLEERGHIGEDASAVRHGCIGMSARPRALAISSPRPFRKPMHGEAMPDIPGNAWQLPCTIGGARGEAGEGIFVSKTGNPSYCIIPKYRDCVQRSLHG